MPSFRYVFVLDSSFAQHFHPLLLLSSVRQLLSPVHFSSLAVGCAYQKYYDSVIVKCTLRFMFIVVFVGRYRLLACATATTEICLLPNAWSNVKTGDYWKVMSVESQTHWHVCWECVAHTSWRKKKHAIQSLWIGQWLHFPVFSSKEVVLTFHQPFSSE